MARKKTKKYTPYTREDLGIPSVVQIGGTSVEVILRPENMVVEKRKKEDIPVEAIDKDTFFLKGSYAIIDYNGAKIYLWPGNKDHTPTKERLQRAFLEEVAHYIFYVMRVNNEDFNGYLNLNEHLVGIFSQLWLQVQKQLKDFTKNLEL